MSMSGITVKKLSLMMKQIEKGSSKIYRVQRDMNFTYSGNVVLVLS